MKSQRSGRLAALIMLLGAACLPGTVPAGAQSRSLTAINGSLTSTASLMDERQYPHGGASFLQGWSTFANLRLKAGGENLSFFLSANVTAVSGFYTQAAPTPVSVGLERLYFRAGGEAVDVEAGLIRIARGYGYVFSPLDLFNPRDATNSVDPQARPVGKWGIHASFFPGDLWKIEAFGLAPDNPLEKGMWGSRLGGATTFSLGAVNVDLLASLFFPEIALDRDPASVSLPPYTSNDFSVVTGFAVKADVKVGLFVEAVYRFDRKVFRQGTYDGRTFHGFEELEAAAGVDYTFGDIYLLAEYSFYGPGHVAWGESLDVLYLSPAWKDYSPLDRFALLDPSKKPLSFARHDYLFLLSRYSAAQDLSLGISCLAGLDDLSALLTAFADYEVMQGLTLQASVLLPVDRRLLDSSAEPGEWGSTALGFHQLWGLAAKVRF